PMGLRRVATQAARETHATKTEASRTPRRTIRAAIQSSGRDPAVVIRSRLNYCAYRLLGVSGIQKLQGSLKRRERLGSAAERHCDMRVMGVETSGRTGSLALLQDGQLLAERTLEETGRRHAQSLVAEVMELLASVSWQPRDVETI